jgi:hypothetical protein
MFTDKFYSKVYFSTIEKAVKRGWKKALGRERHHIIPRSLGGSDDKSNLVYLTCREHFLCHWMLVKMTQGEARNKMLYALMGMRAENEHQNRYHTVFTARVYEHYRIEHARIHSETMKGRPAWNKGRKLEGEELERQRERTKNRKIDPVKQAEGQRKRLEKLKDFKHSEETKLKQSIASKGKPKGPHSEEHRKAISEGGKGIKKKEGHSDNVRKANLGVVSINKDGKEKKVKQDTLDQWLAEGWMLGGRKRKQSQS